MVAHMLKCARTGFEARFRLIMKLRPRVSILVEMAGTANRGRDGGAEEIEAQRKQFGTCPANRG